METFLKLFGFAILGIILHILVELNKLNRQPKGSFSIEGYFKLEMFSIAISFIVSAACVFGSTQIMQIEVLNKWIYFAYIAIGYTGQSLLIAFMGKAQKIIDKTIDGSTTGSAPEITPNDQAEPPTTPTN